MRESSRIILFKENKLLLIYREREGEIYYVFPGGGVEEGETIEECAIREAKEELGIDISINKHVYNVKGEGIFQYLFLVNHNSGIVGTGDEEEYNPNRKSGLQKPIFIEINKLKELNIVSPPIIKQLIEDIEKFGLILDTNTKEIIE